jgi:hypothetical protein
VKNAPEQMLSDELMTGIYGIRIVKLPDGIEIKIKSSNKFHLFGVCHYKRNYMLQRMDSHESEFTKNTITFVETSFIAGMESSSCGYSERGGEVNDNIIFNRKRNLFHTRKQGVEGFLKNEN